MIRPISKIDIDDAAKKLDEVGKDANAPSVNEVEVNAPEKVLADLKAREVLLNHLLKEGHNTQDISKLQKALAATIEELELILSNSEIDALSEKDIA